MRSADRPDKVDGMAANLPKDILAKRAVLYAEKSTDADKNAVAAVFVEAQRFGEALEFLEMTKDAALLDRIREAAIERGDTFLLLQSEKIGEAESSALDWEAVLVRAKARGKFLDAYRALCQLGREEEAEDLRAEKIPEFQPFRPQGK